MAKFLNFSRSSKEEFIEDEGDDYLSITEHDSKTSTDDKIVDVRVFMLDDYEHIREILDVIRGEDTICLIDIHLLRNRDPDELKRAVDKMKKTVEAIDGELVGFHENWVLAAPRQVRIHKGRK